MLLTSFLSFSRRQPKTGRCGHKFTAHQMQPLYYITAFRWNQVIFAVFLKSLRQKWNKSCDRPILPPIWLFRQGHLSSWKIPDPWERWRKKWCLLLSLRSFLFSARKTPDSSYIYISTDEPVVKLLWRIGKAKHRHQKERHCRQYGQNYTYAAQNQTYAS